MKAAVPLSCLPNKTTDYYGLKVVEKTEEKATATPAAPAAEEKATVATALRSPIAGIAIPLTQVDDAAFASEALGKGIAIEPAVGAVVSPINGKVVMVFDTKHAIGLESDEGVEILIHIGLDTVNLKGEGFTTYVKTGDFVEVGDKLVDFDIDFIKASGLRSGGLFVALGVSAKIKGLTILGRRSNISLYCVHK